MRSQSCSTAMADPVLGFADLAGRSVGIFGFGVEGRAAAAQLRRLGIEPVIVDDRGPSAGDGVLATMSGGLEALASCDVVLKTPGLSTYADSVSSLRSQGVLVTSALSCWLTDADRSRVVLITGTKGKSTTASILGHLLNRLGHDTAVVGNIGRVPYDPDVAPSATFTVVEVSSFQAEGLACTTPIIGVTSIGQDHLDWHGTVERYVTDKLSIAAKPGAARAIVADTDALRALAPLLGPDPSFVAPTALDRAIAAALGLAGGHHDSNVAVARGVIEGLLGPVADDRLIAAASGFVPLESRFSEVPPLGAVRVIDDSLATNPLPTIAGLASLGAARVALLVGGHERGVDYAPLGAALAERQGATLVLAMPENGQRILEAVTPSATITTVLVGSLAEAVDRGLAWLNGEGVLVLSPAAPSFGHFIDYRDRAQQFRALVDAHRTTTPPG